MSQKPLIPSARRQGRALFIAGAILAVVCSGAPTRAADPKWSGNDIIPECPDWVHHAVVYQIYPQTFCDSDGDGIGDLNGIIQKLDYVKSLGVDAIWINPFFDSPFNDAGYDIRDYYKIAPRYGNNEDARRLFAEAHKRGLKVLFDYVISYTAIDNPWFTASCEQNPTNTSNWYIWTDNVWKSEPGSSWVHGYGHRNGNFLSNFFWSEPAVNWGYSRPDPQKPWQLPANHPDVLAMRAEMERVMRFWMDMGADGFRADMAGALVKGDDPGHDQLTLQYWQEVREILRKNYPQAFIVSEWSGPRLALDNAFHADFYHWVDGFNDLYQKESWRIGNGMTDGHSFFDREGRGNIAGFLKKYMADYEATRALGYVCLPLGNHDIARLNNRRSTEDLEMIMAFGMTMPGVPFLYYGNEIGMRQLQDLPQIEGAYKPRAGARTPMQWNSGPSLGFSTAPAAKLYLPVDTAADAPNVEEQDRDPESLLNRVRKLIRLKHSEPALAAYASFVPLYAVENRYPFIYSRTSGAETVLVFLNPADNPAKAEFKFAESSEGMRLLAGKNISVRERKSKWHVEVPGRTFAIYKLDR
ncbi:MAG TPA: alpha-amylase family glycosyl hydrolase [Verrucomicrobiae bacterium]|nr:alpha-amylase family glycosyl hydrolase [Verrucomicrobiae bacterium]